MKVFKALFSSKKFVASLGGILFVVLNETLGLGIGQDAIIQILALIGVFVGGQAVADHGKEVEKLRKK